MKTEEDGRLVASNKPYGIADEAATIKDVDDSFREKLEAILKQFEVGKWEGFQKSDKRVLDGDSFDLAVWFDDKTSIHASGYMKWPKNYREFRDAIDALFEKEI